MSNTPHGISGFGAQVSKILGCIMAYAVLMSHAIKVQGMLNNTIIRPEILSVYSFEINKSL